MLYNITASEKTIYDLSLFEKGRKIKKYLMYLTSSKAFKKNYLLNLIIKLMQVN